MKRTPDTAVKQAMGTEHCNLRNVNLGLRMFTLINGERVVWVRTVCLPSSALSPCGDGYSLKRWQGTPKVENEQSVSLRALSLYS